MQNRVLPSFFVISTTGEDHGLLEGEITLFLSIASTSVVIITFSTGAVRNGTDEIG